METQRLQKLKAKQVEFLLINAEDYGLYSEQELLDALRFTHIFFCEKMGEVLSMEGSKKIQDFINTIRIKEIQRQRGLDNPESIISYSEDEESLFRDAMEGFNEAKKGKGGFEKHMLKRARALLHRGKYMTTAENVIQFLTHDEDSLKKFGQGLTDEDLSLIWHGLGFICKRMFEIELSPVEFEKESIPIQDDVKDALRVMLIKLPPLEKLKEMGNGN